MTRQEIEDFLEQEFPEEPVILADGLESAFLGFVQRMNEPVLACYDQDRCLQALVEESGMSQDDAWDWFSFNTLGSYVGPGTPLFIKLC